MRSQTRRVVCHILLCLFFITSPEGVFAGEVTVETPKIISIINNVIDAYGGKEAIEAIRSFRAKGEIEAFMLRDHGTYEVFFKRGRKLRIETKYKHSSESRILNGDRGYRGIDTLPFEEVSGPRYVAMVYQYKHLDILHDLIKGTYEILSVGKTTINGNNAGIFKLTDKEGAIIDIYIDEQNSFIVKVTAYFSSENKNIDLSTEFSDFKKVGDSVFPFRITHYAGGLKVAETVIDKYSINPDMADSLFEPAIFPSL